MSSQHSLNHCLEQSDLHQPGQISIYELMNPSVPMDEQKKFSIDMNDDEMDEMNFDLPNTNPIPQEFNYSPESGQMNLQTYQRPTIEPQIPPQHFPSITSHFDSCPDQILSPQIPSFQTPILLQPPIKTVKNSTEDYPEIKLCSKNQDNTKEETTPSKINFSPETQKIQHYPDLNFSNITKSAKEDFYAKKISQKNEFQKQKVFLFPKQLATQHCSKILKEFKNQPYEIRNRYFKEQSQTYTKYILNMRKTLQKEYQRCRLQSTFYHNLCEWEIIDLNQNDFCIVLKALEQPSEKGKRYKGQYEIDGQQGGNKKCEDFNVQEGKMKFMNVSQSHFKMSPQLLVEFENLKREKIQNSSSKFRSYLRKIMVQMSNFIDMTDQVQRVLKMQYKQLMAFYASVVGLKEVIHYEEFSFQETNNGNQDNEAIVEEVRIQVIQDSSKEQSNIMMDIQQQPMNNQDHQWGQEKQQNNQSHPLCLQTKTDKYKYAQKSGDFQKHTSQEIPLQSEECHEPQQLSQSQQLQFQPQQMDQLKSVETHAQMKDAEHKQIIEILDELEHDQDTPVFGGPNATETIGEEMSKLIIEEEQLHQQQQNPQPQSDTNTSHMPIVIEITQQEEKSQIQQKKPQLQLRNETLPHEHISDPIQQSHHQQQESHNQQKNPEPSQIIIESEQEDIIVPIKEPQPIQNDNNNNNKLNAQNIRKLLLDADSDWTDIIKNASEAQILQFYQELTSKVEIPGSQACENTTSQPIALQEPSNSQQKPITEPIQHQPIIQEPKIASPQITNVPSIFTSPQQPLPQPTQQIIPQSPTHQQSKEDEQLDIITEALFQTSPELKEQIMKLSKQDLKALYKETMEENKKKEENRIKNKKRKNQSQPIIDLEDQADNHVNILPQNKQSKDTQPRQEYHLQNNQSSQKPAFSYMAQYEKRKSQAKNQAAPAPTSTIYVNKTLLYKLIQSHDYLHKLKSITSPKESIKYQERTEKEVALLYLNHLKKNNIAKGPFESTIKPKSAQLTVLCKKKSDIKNEKFKKMSKEGLCVKVASNLSEDKKQRIMELRQRRIQGTVPFQESFNESTHNIPPITSLPSSIPNMQYPIVSEPTSVFPQMVSQPKNTPRRRYCLIVQEELDARDEQEIGLQANKKRVKKSSGIEEEQELFSILKRMIQLEE